jgi:hypothetical protein
MRESIYRISISSILENRKMTLSLSSRIGAVLISGVVVVSAWAMILGGPHSTTLPAGNVGSVTTTR